MPKIFQAFHLPMFEIDKNNNLGHVLKVRVINDWIAKSIGFFVPVFLYQLGQQQSYTWLKFLTFGETQKGILLIALYFAYVRLIVFLGSMRMGALIAGLGTRVSLLLNLFFQIGYFLFLLFSRSSLYFLFIAGIFHAAHVFLLNTVYLTLFSLFSLKKHLGEDLSLSEFLVQLVGIVVPALSGIIIVKFGFESLFMLSLVGVIINLIVILSMDTIKFKTIPSWSSFRLWLKQNSHFKAMISYVGRYINDSALSLWSIYVLLMVGTIDRVGFAFSLSLFFSMTIIFFAGIYFDHTKSRKPFIFSGGLLSILWMSRILVTNIFSIVLVDTIEKLTSSFHWLFFDAMSLEQSKKDKVLAFFTYRELVMSFFGVMFWLFIIGLFFLPTNWYVLFGLGALGVFLSLFMSANRENFN